MDDNKKKFMNNIVKHIKTFTTDEEEHAAEEEPSQPAAPDKIIVEPVNSEDQTKNAPGKQLKINRGAVSAGKDSFFSKLSATLSERAIVGGLLLYAVYVVNLIGMTIFTRRSGLGITQSLLYKVHIDSIAFKSFTFLDVSILVSYIFSFLFGGLVIFVLLRIGFLLSDLCGLAYSHKVTRWILFLFMAVFAVTALCLLLAGHSILSVAVYRWATPLFACGGGLAMYCMSLRNVEID